MRICVAGPEVVSQWAMCLPELLGALGGALTYADLASK